jgi:putative intracellular protease/amidase
MIHLSPINRVFILSAPGFEEASTIYCLERMRRASLHVLLVSLSAGLVTGQHGITVCPDLTLDQIDLNEPVKLVIIAGGRQCASSLLADPRIHRLLQGLPMMNASAAVLTTAGSAVSQIYPPDSSPIRFIAQNDTSLEEFVTRLINLSLV